MPVQTLTDTDFTHQLATHDKVVVKYFADWCGSCKLFAPKFKKLAEQPENAEVTFLDVNAEENPLARKLAGVDNLPFIAVFKQGKLLAGTSTSKPEAVQALIGQLN